MLGADLTFCHSPVKFYLGWILGLFVISVCNLASYLHILNLSVVKSLAFVKNSFSLLFVWVGVSARIPPCSAGKLELEKLRKWKKSF